MIDWKLRYERAWGVWFGLCDQGRTDERMALVGYAVVYALLLGLLLAVLWGAACVLAMSPLWPLLLGVARAAWAWRTR